MNLDRRAFLTASSALLSTVAIAPVARAAAPDAAGSGLLTGEAVRKAADALELRWQGAKRPVRVFASSDADAPEALMRVVSTGASGKSLTTSFAAAPRPYFLLQSGSMQTRIAERLLPLEGGRNFRDLGGYIGADGRQVRWGRLYRSGVMAGLTAEDLVYLAGLGIRTVCDLRAADERAREQHPFADGSGVTVAAFDYELTSFDMRAIVTAPSREAAISVFADGYVRTAQTLTPHYRDVFQRLLRRETPLAFNCTAGKDRTGLLSALILSVLGVSREAVIADYALSEVYVPPDTYLAALRGDGAATGSISAEQRAMFAAMPEPIARVLMGTPPEVMAQTLDHLDANFGGPVAFVQRQYGVSDIEIDLLRSIYLAA